MTESVHFPFVDANPAQSGTSFMPLLPIALSHGERRIETTGLLDTGTTVNVLPCALGVQLGFVWEEQQTPIVLTGNLARLPARGILVSASVAQFAPVRLVFAWTQAEDVRLVLGQMNFFLEFDTCFFRTRLDFEVKPKSVN